MFIIFFKKNFKNAERKKRVKRKGGGEKGRRGEEKRGGERGGKERQGYRSWEKKVSTGN